MAITIAISGKGGSGKTTLAAMIIKVLLAQPHSKGILAVDADPNSCLSLALGVEVEGTIAALREQSRNKEPDNTGMDRVRAFEYGLEQVITEAKGFDLLTMGRPEGPDCYCAANNLLRKFLDRLADAYTFEVLDNEAGMEHLSRRTTNNVDLLCIVAEPSPVGTITAQRINALAAELPIAVKQTGVIWNSTAPIDDYASIIEKQQAKIENIETFGCVPYDKTVHDVAMQGKNVFDLDESSPAMSAVREIINRKLNI